MQLKNIHNKKAVGIFSDFSLKCITLLYVLQALALNAKEQEQQEMDVRQHFCVLLQFNTINQKLV